MKTKTLVIIPIIVALVLVAALAFKNADNKKSNGTGGFAVVELFTSEGCSSCPPADAVLAKILKEDQNKPVYILGFHVDYWNHLGWKDQFSSPEYSARQRQYASWLKLEQIYTPQIVVNGKTEFVGSEESTLRAAIKSNLGKAAGDELTFNNVRFGNGQLSFQYQTKSNSGNRVLLVAFVQKNAQSKVKAGENNGSILNHVNIVRNFITLPVHGSEGTANIKVPAAYNTHDWDMISFIQNNSTGEVLCAQKVLILSI